MGMGVDMGMNLGMGVVGTDVNKGVGVGAEKCENTGWTIVRALIEWKCMNRTRHGGERRILVRVLEVLICNGRPEQNSSINHYNSKNGKLEWTRPTQTNNNHREARCDSPEYEQESERGG